VHLHITVGEALNLPAMKTAVLVAGHSGLNRVISSVNIMEVPEITRFVKENELLLTTTYPIRDNPAALERLIPSLVSKGVAALAIKPVFYDNKVPGIMIEQADTYGFPLIQLPENASFNELINPILGEILNRQARILKKNDEVHQSFTELVLQGGSLQDIAHMLASLQNAPVSIHSVQFHLLALALPQEESEYAELLSALKDLRQEMEERLGGRSGPVTCDVHGKTVKIHVHPVVVGGEAYAYIVMWLDEKASYEVNVVEQAATITALELTKMRAVLETELRFRTHFILELLQGQITSRDDVLTRGAAYGWDLSVPYKPVVLEITDDANSARMKQLWMATMQATSYNDIISVNVGSRLLLLLRADSDADHQAVIVKWINHIQKNVGETANVVYAGVGRVVHDIMNLKQGVDEAIQALEIGRLMNPGQVVTHYDDLGVYRALHPCAVNQESLAFAHELLDNLVEHDRSKKTDFIRTLEVYLKHNCNLKKAAEDLYVHYNTLRYRIAKIEEIAGVSLDCAEHRFCMQVALLLLKMEAAMNRRLDCTGFAGHVEKTYNEVKGRVRNYEREQISQKV
jgi:purine catabolism regulator